MEKYTIRVLNYNGLKITSLVECNVKHKIIIGHPMNKVIEEFHRGWGSTLGPILFYCISMTRVSECWFSVLFADDANMFSATKIWMYYAISWMKISNIWDSLQCNKSSLNVLKTKPTTRYLHLKIKGSLILKETKILILMTSIAILLGSVWMSMWQHSWYIQRLIFKKCR